jgi:YD repeat-containing protein
MTSMGDADGTIFAYAFDGEGNRVRQSLNDCLSTRFVYDGANAVVEMNANNEVVWAWVNGPGLDQPVERIAFIGRQRLVLLKKAIGVRAGMPGNEELNTLRSIKI